MVFPMAFFVFFFQFRYKTACLWYMRDIFNKIPAINFSAKIIELSQAEFTVWGQNASKADQAGNSVWMEGVKPQDKEAEN